MKKLITFISNGFLLLISLNSIAGTMKDFRASYLSPYRQKRTFQTKLDLVNAYDKLDTAQDRHLADLEFKTYGINLANLRNEVLAAQKKQQPSEQIFNQLLSKYTTQADQFQSAINLIKSDLRRVVRPQTGDIAETKALNLKLAQKIKAQRDLLKQKLQSLETAKNDLSNYYESIKNQISGDFQKKALAAMASLSKRYSTLKLDIDDIDRMMLVKRL